MNVEFDLFKGKHTEIYLKAIKSDQHTPTPPQAKNKRLIQQKNAHETFLTLEKKKNQGTVKELKAALQVSSVSQLHDLVFLWLSLATKGLLRINS